MIKKVISGFQDGIDMCGIKAAHELGIETGGWMTKGCRTHSGPRFDYKELYNAVEDSTPYYWSRTYKNVKDADITLIIARDFRSPGTVETIKACQRYGKPFLKVNENKPPMAIEISGDIKEIGAQIINVAGNSLRSAPGIDIFGYRFLLEVFKLVNNIKK